MKRTLHTFFSFNLLSILLIAVACPSCNKFEGDQQIPAYVYIESFSLTTDYAVEGSDTHNITDVWLYVDSQLIGAFEMPATIPVLVKGKRKLEVRPGIKLNGIAATRAPYPFYKPYQLDDFELVEDSIHILHPTTSYYEGLNFAWTEDFEYAAISMDKTTNSDTIIEKTSPINNLDALLSDYSAYSGVVHLEGDKTKFQIVSDETFKLPGRGSPVFLELDYKCELPVQIGLYARESYVISNLPQIIITPDDKWKKIYINVSPVVSQYSQAESFQFYFEGALSTETEAKYYFDNIKLIHRSN